MCYSVRVRLPVMNTPQGEHSNNKKDTTMKYITMLALTAAAFVSCQQQQPPADPVPDPVPSPPVMDVKK